MKIKLKIGVLKSIWKLKSWKLNLKIGILKNYLRMEYLKNNNNKIIIIIIIKFEN